MTARREPKRFRMNRRRFLVQSAASGLTLAQAASWPVRAQISSPSGTMFRGNAAKTGEMPGPDVIGPPNVRWQVIEDRGEWLAPAVANERVYVSRINHGLSAFDALTGVPLWEVPAGEFDRFDSSPAAADGLVVSGSGPYTLLGIDAATGGERWRYVAVTDLSGISAAARDYAETLYAPLFSSPTIVGGTVYVGAWSPTGDGTIGENPANGIYAVAATTGALRWHFPIPHGAISSPAAVDNVIYVVDRRATVYAIDANTGLARWSIMVPGIATSSPAVGDGSVLVTIRSGPESPGGSVLALRAGSGIVAWRQAAVEPSSPALSGGVVFVAGQDGTLTALNIGDGSTKWTIRVEGALAAPTLVSGGALYVGSTTGTIHALDPKTGKEQWRFTRQRAFLSSPTVVGGVAFVGDDAGTLYALD